MSDKLNKLVVTARQTKVCRTLEGLSHYAVKAEGVANLASETPCEVEFFPDLESSKVLIRQQDATFSAYFYLPSPLSPTIMTRPPAILSARYAPWIGHFAVIHVITGRQALAKLISA